MTENPQCSSAQLHRHDGPRTLAMEVRREIAEEAKAAINLF